VTDSILSQDQEGGRSDGDAIVTDEQRGHAAKAIRREAVVPGSLPAASRRLCGLPGPHGPPFLAGTLPGTIPVRLPRQGWV